MRVCRMSPFPEGALIKPVPEDAVQVLPVLRPKDGGNGVLGTELIDIELLDGTSIPRCGLQGQ